MTRLLSTLLAAFGVLTLMLAGCNTQGTEESTEPAAGEEMTDSASMEVEGATDAEAPAAATDAAAASEATAK